MKKFKFEVGEKYGYFEIIEKESIVKNGHTYVTTKCKCGKTQLSSLSDLRNNKTSGCRSCKARERSRKINIGDKFKSWIVIDGPITNQHQCLLWKVQCEKCKQSEKWVQGNELMNSEKGFQCQKCAAIERGNKQAISNGKHGDLTLTQFARMQRSAEKRNLEFKISIKDLWELFIFQNQICAITGDYISSIEDASLDRIDSSIGYIKNNIQWVTYQANVSKHIMSMNELYNFCTKVLNHANQQGSQPLKKLEPSETNC